MSAPTLEDNGIYRILAGPFRSAAADDFFGPAATLRSKFGSVFGSRVADEDNQKWKLKSLGDQKYFFESVAYPGSYTSVYVPEAGTAVIGLPNPTIWEIVIGPGFTSRIRPVDGKGYWFLPDPRVDVSISLQNLDNPLQGTGTWGLEKVGA